MHVFVIAPAPAPEISCMAKLYIDGACSYVPPPLLGFAILASQTSSVAVREVQLARPDMALVTI